MAEVTSPPSRPVGLSHRYHPPGAHNRDYLRAKQERMGHLLHHQGLALDAEMIHEEWIRDQRS